MNNIVSIINDSLKNTKLTKKEMLDIAKKKTQEYLDINYHNIFELIDTYGNSLDSFQIRVVDTEYHSDLEPMLGIRLYAVPDSNTGLYNFLSVGINGFAFKENFTPTIDLKDLLQKHDIFKRDYVK